MAYKIGDSVRWTSSNTEKVGIVIAIVQKGNRPLTEHIKDAGMSRDHESYVVRGFKTIDPKKRKANYWPVVSLLMSTRRPLRPDEIATVDELMGRADLRHGITQGANARELVEQINDIMPTVAGLDPALDSTLARCRAFILEFVG